MRRKYSDMLDAQTEDADPGLCFVCHFCFFLFSPLYMFFYSTNLVGLFLLIPLSHFLSMYFQFQI